VEEAVYGILNQGVAAEQIKGWRQQAIRDERVRQARRGRTRAHGGWWLWRRRPWPSGPLPGKPGVADQPVVSAGLHPAMIGERAAAAARHPAAARPSPAVVSQRSAESDGQQPAGRRAA
jgi:hypothetical protein